MTQAEKLKFCEMARQMIQMMATYPDFVRATLQDHGVTATISIETHTADQATLVGRRGATVRAIETVVNATAEREGCSFRVVVGSGQSR